MRKNYPLSIFDSSNEHRKVVETGKNFDGCLALKNIPDSYVGVNVSVEENGMWTPLSERLNEGSLEQDEFRIQYTGTFTGACVYTHSCHIGKNIQVEMYSKGSVSISAQNIIMLNKDGKIDLTKTLQDYINEIQHGFDFTEADQRENIDSNDSMPVILGKIKKWFTDLVGVVKDTKFACSSETHPRPFLTLTKLNRSNSVSTESKKIPAVTNIPLWDSSLMKLTLPYTDTSALSQVCICEIAKPELFDDIAYIPEQHQLQITLKGDANNPIIVSMPSLVNRTEFISSSTISHTLTTNSIRADIREKSITSALMQDEAVDSRVLGFHAVDWDHLNLDIVDEIDKKVEFFHPETNTLPEYPKNFNTIYIVDKYGEHYSPPDNTTDRYQEYYIPFPLNDGGFAWQKIGGIRDKSITANQIADETITGVQIKNASITDSELGNRTIANPNTGGPITTSLTNILDLLSSAYRNHKSAAELDHPEKSVKSKHIDNGAVTKEKLTQELVQTVDNAFCYMNPKPNETNVDKLMEVGYYRCADDAGTNQFPERNTDGAMLVIPTSNKLIQAMFTSTGNLYTRMGMHNPLFQWETEWTQVGNPVGAKVQFVQCAGSHDEDKINAALDKSPNIIYLVGNCTLSADNLIDITDPINPHKSIIKRCENIIIDGTYCQGIEFDGDTCPAEATVYTLFSGDYDVRFRNCTFTQRNCTHDKHLPRLFYGGSRCSFRDCVFTGCSVNQPAADYGGWIYAQGEFQLSDCSFSDFSVQTADGQRSALIRCGDGSCIENCFYQWFTLSTIDPNAAGGNAYLFYTGKQTSIINNHIENIETSGRIMALEIVLGQYSIFGSNQFFMIGEASPDPVDIVYPHITCNTSTTITENKFSVCDAYMEMISAGHNSIITQNHFEGIFGSESYIIAVLSKNNVQITNNYITVSMAGFETIFCRKGTFNTISDNIIKYTAGNVTADTQPIYCTSTHSHVCGNKTNFSTIGEIAGEGTITDGNIITNEVTANV